MSDTNKDELTGHPQRVWTAQTWLGSETLESIAELNDQSLELLMEEARVCEMSTGHPLVADLRDLWLAMDEGARRRASYCPYLLVDSGFVYAQRWAWVRGHQVRDQERIAQSKFFNSQRAITVSRLVLTYAWHLARSQNTAARLLLGMSAQCAEHIAACTLNQIHELAETHPEWLQPRWPGHLRVWRELLVTAISGESQALEQVRTRGLQLLAAEVRLGGSLPPAPFG
jgi:hypothetical protein